MRTEADPITWECLCEKFLERIFQRDVKEAKAQQFMNLRQRYMMVKEYELNFTKLSRYARHMVANSKDQINRFMFEVLDLVKNNV